MEDASTVILDEFEFIAASKPRRLNLDLKETRFSAAKWRYA